MDFAIPVFKCLEFKHHTMDLYLPQPCDGVEYSPNCLYLQRLAYFECLLTLILKLLLSRLTGQARQWAKIMQSCLQDRDALFKQFKVEFQEEALNIFEGGLHISSADRSRGAHSARRQHTSAVSLARGRSVGL